MKVFYTDQFHFHLPEGHRFPLEKYVLLRRAIESSDWCEKVELLVPEEAEDEQLLLAHDQNYINRVIDGSLAEKEIRRIGLPWSPELVERSRRSVGGTIAACRAALVDGIALSLAGGTHHAGWDHGEGFCLFNDVVVAARTMQVESRIRRLVIIDCDVHQGNGTASILSNDPTIYTFSIHGQKNFPFRKFPSNLDIGLEDGMGDEEYLDLLFEGTQRALAFSNPELAIYLAGADPYAGDRLGRLGLTKTGLATRDQMVIDLCLEANVPMAIVMSGGYGKDIRDTVDIHLRTVYLATMMIERIQIHKV